MVDDRCYPVALGLAEGNVMKLPRFRRHSPRLGPGGTAAGNRAVHNAVRLIEVRGKEEEERMRGISRQVHFSAQRLRNWGPALCFRSVWVTLRRTLWYSNSSIFFGGDLPPMQRVGADHAIEQTS